MTRRVESPDAASRRERGEDDGRAASQPVKLGEAALQSALTSFPRSSNR